MIHAFMRHLFRVSLPKPARRLTREGRHDQNNKVTSGGMGRIESKRDEIPGILKKLED